MNPSMFMEKYQTGFRAILIFALSIVFVSLCIHQSRIKGRLCSFPNYDDVVYLYQGALLQKMVADHGIGGFQGFLKESDLHSPFSIFLAAVSFAVLGIRDDAPYIGNLVVVVGYLAGLTWFFKRLKFSDWLLCAIMFLTLPFMTIGVVEFRPDIAWAVVTGFGVVWFVTEPVVISDYSKAALSGLFLGLSLIIKPTTFAMTVLLYSGAIISRAAIFYLTRRQAPSPGVIRCLKGSVISLIVASLVAGPYWARYGHEVWDYFYLNSFGANKAVWSLDIGLHDSIMYYINGTGGASNLGRSGAIVFMFAFLCAVFSFVRFRRIRLTMVFLMLIILGAWGVNSVAPMKQPFLGGGFYGLLIFSSAYVIAMVYGADDLGFKSRVVSRVALCLVCAGSIASYAWPECSDYFKTRMDSLANLKGSNEFLVRNLKESGAGIPKNILFTQAGPIIMEGVGLSMLRNNLNTAMHWGTFIRTADGFRYTYPDYDWVLLQDPGMKGSSPNMPSEGILPEFQAVIAADSNYKVHAEYVDSEGKRITIYSRIGRNHAAE
jgi:hypothetical protein